MQHQFKIFPKNTARTCIYELAKYHNQKRHVLKDKFKKQGVQQILKTLKTMNDPKFDLVTPRTVNSTKFVLNDLENPENYPQEI